MSDSSNLTVTSMSQDQIFHKSTIGKINPNATNQQIKSWCEQLQDLTSYGTLYYATRTDSTKIIVTEPDDLPPSS